MVDMIASPFMWGTDGKPRSPAQVKQQRDIAEALLASAPQGKGWASALGEGLKGLSAGINNNQAGIYEQQGLERAGELFAGIGPESDSSMIAAALADPAAIWATPAQSGVAEALLGEQMRMASPDYALDLAYKQAQIAAMEREAQMGPGGNETFFGNAVPMQDENGNIVLGQMSNQGRWQPLQGAEGYSPAPTTKQIDTGTEIITTDIYGNELYRTPKQNLEAAYQTATGTATGKTDAENKALYESMNSKLPGLKSVIGELGELANTATYTQTGQLIDNIVRETGQTPSEAAVARTKYIAMVDNQVLPLLRDTFGAAFTVKEGETLRATLGDPNKSPIEKQAILESFIEQKERDIQGLRTLVPGESEPAGGNVIDWTDL